MSQTNPAQTDLPPQDILAEAERQFRLNMSVYNSLLEKITPWLLDVGSWIFGGLIAFNLLIMASLLTVGPVDLPIKLSTVAFALTLPLNVTGLVLLRLIQDLSPGKFEQEVAQTFQDFGLVPGDPQIPTVTMLQALRERGTRITRRFALGIVEVSVVLTLTGIITAMWHMSWWIGAAFAAMVLICCLLVLIAMFAAQPPVTAEEKKRRRAYRDDLLKQAKKRNQQTMEQAKQLAKEQAKEQAKRRR